MQSFLKRLPALCLALMPMVAAGQAHPMPEVPHVEQEIPRAGEERRPEDKLKDAAGSNLQVQVEKGEGFETKEERQREAEREREELSGHITGSPEEMAKFWDELLSRRLAKLVQEPTPRVLWKRAVGEGGKVKYDAYLEDATVPGGRRWLSADALHALENGGRPVVHEGEIPEGPEWGPKWEAFTGQHRNVAIHVTDSANQEPRAIAEATALGTLVLNPGMVRIFNALPREVDPVRSQLERRRMGLERAGTVEDWKLVNQQIEKQTEGVFRMEVATREVVLEELSKGRSDTILLYAHHSNGTISLAGSETSGPEGQITLADLAKIQRRGDPAVAHRRIVLAACSTARVGEAGSIARVLLKNGIARTVFATDKPYDAREIPALLARLKEQSLQQGGGQLKQYVRLEVEPILWRRERKGDE